jgi:hypothetical protein
MSACNTRHSEPGTISITELRNGVMPCALDTPFAETTVSGACMRLFGVKTPPGVASHAFQILVRPLRALLWMLLDPGVSIVRFGELSRPGAFPADILKEPEGGFALSKYSAKHLVAGNGERLSTLKKGQEIHLTNLFVTPGNVEGGRTSGRTRVPSILT